MDLNCRRFSFVQYANYIYSAPASVNNNINPTMMLKNVDITIIPRPTLLYPLSIHRPSIQFVVALIVLIFVLTKSVTSCKLHVHVMY